jgi:hypothetical protein
MKRTPILFLSLFVLGGCTHLGPSSIEGNRLDYNMAIQQTNDQELLLNLVRLKYRDRIYFMNVERVISAMEFNRAVAAGANFPPNVNPTVNIGPFAAAYNEKPSIFYTPLVGDKFVRQMLTPIGLETILMLTRSGWSSERVLLQTVQTMNGLKNAPSASGPTPEYEPEYREFREAVQILRSLQVRGLIGFGRSAGEGKEYELRIDEQAANDADVMRFRELLHLDPGFTRYRVLIGFNAPDNRSIAVTTRAMTAVLYYLSQSVRPPQADEEAGRVTRTRTATGEYFDWGGMFDGVLRIESASSRPENAAVSVPYRGNWFYIRDEDLQSKTTFSLLSQIMTLQAGPAVAADAALSFSVGGS